MWLNGIFELCVEQRFGVGVYTSREIKEVGTITYMTIECVNNEVYWVLVVLCWLNYKETEMYRNVGIFMNGKLYRWSAIVFTSLRVCF